MSLTAAVVGGIVLLVGAIVVPVYQPAGVPGPGVPAGESRTLVGVNGWDVLLVAGMPLVAALSVGYALRLRAGRRGAGAFAWSVAILLAFLTLLAMASIGIFLLPVTAALIAACAAHRGRAEVAAAV